MRKNKHIFFLISLSIVWLVILVVFILFSVKGLLVLRSYYSSNILSNAPAQLLKGDTVKGRFISQYPNLGAVSVRFDTNGRINTDTLLFKIRQTTDEKWYYVNSYNVNQFQPSMLFPFGFPPIHDSQGKQYVIELESMKGKIGNAVSLSRTYPIVEVNQKVFLHDLVTNKTLLFPIIISVLVYFLFESTQKGNFLIACLISFMTLFVIFYRRSAKRSMKSIGYWVSKYFFLHSFRNKILVIMFLGLLMRLLLAIGPYNADGENVIKLAALAQHHIFNVYSHNQGYNYSPILYFLIGAIAYFQALFNILPLLFFWRFFISLFDVGSLFILLRIAKIKNISQVKTALLFFLNPVSIIISGHHGQFDNIAIFFLLLTLLIHYEDFDRKGFSTFLQWISLTFGLLVKHIIIFQLLVFWRFKTKKIRNTFLLFALSLLVFLISFVPYWSGAKQQILSMVFLYGGIQGNYGITYLLTQWFPGVTIFGLSQVTLFKAFFMFFLFFIPVFIKQRDIARNMLFMFLFFLSFTSGIGAQYFVLPIALGALFPSKWFYLYSLIVTLGFIGGIEQAFPFIIPGLSFVSFNVIWLFTLLWFFSESLCLSESARMLYYRYILLQ